MSGMVLSKAVEGFLLSRAAGGYSQETLKLYRWALSTIVDYLKDPELRSITPANLQSYYAYLQKEYVPRRAGGDTSPLKPRSIENAWTAIRSFYNWASSELGLQNGLMAFSSVPGTNRLKSPRSSQKKSNCS